MNDQPPEAGWFDIEETLKAAFNKLVAHRIKRKGEDVVRQEIRDLLDGPTDAAVDATANAIIKNALNK